MYTWFTDLPTGLERDKFDNKTVTFEEHIKEEHNLWHYLYFIVLVRVKDSTEYTGPESYVAQMIKVRISIVVTVIVDGNRFVTNGYNSDPFCLV